VKVNQSLTLVVGVNVGVGPPGVAVGPTGVVGTFDVGELVGVIGTAVGVGDSTSVGVSVGVGVVFSTVRLVMIDPIAVRTLLPLETRASHPSVVWPANKPLTVKVNTIPLVVALLP